VIIIPSNFEKKAKALIGDLLAEIRHLEAELEGKKDILSKLQKLGGVSAVRRTRRGGRRGITPAVRIGGRTRRAIHGRRKSKNRDLVLEAARSFSGKFKLHELQEKVLRANSSFGGNHPSGTLIAVLKTTPEIKRIKRGEYKFKH
jgi:hypothetical protein